MTYGGLVLTPSLISRMMLKNQFLLFRIPQAQRLPIRVMDPWIEGRRTGQAAGALGNVSWVTALSSSWTSQLLAFLMLLPSAQDRNSKERGTALDGRSWS